MGNIGKLFGESSIILDPERHLNCLTSETSASVTCRRSCTWTLLIRLPSGLRAAHAPSPGEKMKAGKDSVSSQPVELHQVESFASRDLASWDCWSCCICQCGAFLNCSLSCSYLGRSGSDRRQRLSRSGWGARLDPGALHVRPAAPPEVRLVFDDALRVSHFWHLNKIHKTYTLTSYMPILYYLLVIWYVQLI